MNRRTIAAIAAGALAFRLALMVVRGDYIVYDEGYYLLLARSVGAGAGFALNGLPHAALSPLQPLMVAALTLPGVPDLWVSRLMGALSSALLIVPVMAVTRRLVSDRAALAAGLLVAAAPALMSFTPFFPGRSWNLYFGTEPLYLLAVLSATAIGMEAVASGSVWRYAATGALAAAAYLCRAEGIVAAPLIFLAMAGDLMRRRVPWREWRRFAIAALVAVLTVAPYVAYLRTTLGRWAFSGRVQAASRGDRPTPTTREAARHGGSVLEDFVWRGNVGRFTSELHRLAPDGSRMASQYWGVVRDEQGTSPEQPAARHTGPAAIDSGVPIGTTALPPMSTLAGLWRGLRAVMPLWFMVLGIAGLALWARKADALWLAPVAAAAVIPVLFSYIEPRVLLGLVPLTAIGAGCLAVAAGEQLARHFGVRHAWSAVPALLALLLVWPAVRDGLDARSNRTPLQQVATAQRAVGHWLNDNLPPNALVMSWHPAIAIWARRDWRVLPEDSLARIVNYARRLGVGAIVLSRVNPSPIADLPRPFTVLLLDSASVLPDGAGLSVEPVFTAPLLFVGRLPGPSR
ncbi:MAG TPA: glycosyltransferase family 39 protein [Gemmatimonadales bacterium]|nr:glycosyltransferase family 39 protein [Gemmatimonadales bacterium]